MKKIICVILTLLLAFLCMIPAFAAEEEIQIGVTAFPEITKTKIAVQKDGDEDILYLYLPSGCDESNLTVVLPGKHTVTVDGRQIADGISTSVFSAGEHTVAVDGQEKTLRVLKSENLPSVYIDTESGSLEKIHESKSNKEKGDFTLVENGSAVIDCAELKSIKGRGNSTWAADKKPYNIKFDKKTDVLGMGKAKKWSLLANHFDATLLRNSVAFDLAESFGLRYTPSYRTVDLYINGRYEGNYQILESVEIGETRVDITDLENANEEANPGTDVEKAQRRGAVDSYAPGTDKWVKIKSPADYSGGYLLETEMPDRYLNEICGFVTNNGQAIVLKSPEYASEKEVRYIEQIFNDAENAIVSSTGKNDKGKHYTEYFDMDQLVKMYILTEYTFHRDAGQSSCYFYKDAGEDALHAGPAWDFDLSFGNTRYSGKLPFNVADPETWWANALFYMKENAQSPTIFTRLYRQEDFRSTVSQEWKSLNGKISNELERLPEMIDTVASSAVMNAFRWNLLNGDTVEQKKASFLRECDKLSDFAMKRRMALDRGFAENGAEVYYDANGGTGYLYNGEMLTIGDSVTAREINHAVTPITGPDGYVFDGWNTRPDGTGRGVNAGEKLLLSEKTTVLYAQWKSVYSPQSIVPELLRFNHQNLTLFIGDTLECGEVFDWIRSDNTIRIEKHDAPNPADDDPAATGDMLRVCLEDGTEALAYTIIVRNDIDGNGKVNSSDARTALRYAARIETPDDIRRLASDADGNGKTTSADARMILRIGAGLG
ncbi:MAG: CotH kinase family protein [Clostridia bacterium]|nr:CotH kinase family protein [Clostridia bacterium]